MLQIKGLNNTFFLLLFRFFYRTAIFLYFSVTIQVLSAQILPENNANLFQTHILFQWESVVNADTYVLEIIDLTANRSFLKDTFPLPGGFIKNFEWKHQYQWKFTAYGLGKKIYTSPTRNFSIHYNYKVNPSVYRHKITKKSLYSDSLYIFVDNPGLILDLEGNPIWFYPDTAVARVFNLQILPNGNVAALKPKGVKSANENLVLEEISLTGKKIWKAPNAAGVSGDTTEFYHHDFQKLSNGNYLVAGNEFVKIRVENSTTDMYIRYGTVIEYSPKGEVLWAWNSKNYLKNEDVFIDGMRDNPSHLNSLWLDEKTNHLWVSFRYIDRIIVIDRANGKIIESYGKKMPSGDARIPFDFYHQHSAKPLQNEQFLMMYDNRTGFGKDSASRALILEIPKGKDSVLKEKYSFYTRMPGRRQSWSESKGDIDQIADSLFLIDMGSIPRTIIIDTTKGIVWQCDHESRQFSGEIWSGVEENYRADWSRTLYPQRWSLTVGKGDRKIQEAKYPMVLYNFGLKGSYIVKVFNANDELALRSTYHFSDAENSQFMTVYLPKRAPKGQKIGYITVTHPQTGEELFRQWILRK